MGTGDVARDSLGDRMKENYEDRQRFMLTRRTPVIIRVDGRAFHTFTRGCMKPFDQRIVDSMVGAAEVVAADAQGCKAAYVQSDEASFLLTDYDELQTQPWFGYNKSKVETIAASVMTAAFNRFWDDDARDPAIFDARAFNVPREEVANYFLWRMKDWERNSVSMYCRAFASHKQMHGQGKADQHELIYAAGGNWATDLSAQLRNGTWIVKQDGNWTVIHDTLPSFGAVSTLLDPHINVDARLSLPSDPET